MLSWASSGKPQLSLVSIQINVKCTRIYITFLLQKNEQFIANYLCNFLESTNNFSPVVTP